MKEPPQAASPISGNGQAAAQLASWQRTFSFESDMTRKYVVPPKLVKKKQ
jgi:hypothetical protein